MLRRIFNRISFVLLILGLIGCGEGNSQEKAQADNPNLTVEQAYELLQSDTNVVLIDVRTPQEFNGPLGHVKGALLKPVQQINTWAPELNSLKDKKVLLICRSGNRSGYALRYLQQQGFTNVYNVMGGMRAWNSKGLPVEKQSEGVH
ncbi:MAG: rhodanese-like domain-containing protein [Calditrichaeota bacterium]|nr:MAG: rhodanese-like domain-containing protein [Calditrichota bacterium]